MEKTIWLDMCVSLYSRYRKYPPDGIKKEMCWTSQQQVEEKQEEK
jgi:hypothetical protein